MPGLLAPRIFRRAQSNRKRLARPAPVATFLAAMLVIAVPPLAARAQHLVPDFEIGGAQGPYLPRLDVVEFRGSFKAGSAGNAVVFRVENTTAFPVVRLNLRPQLPAKFLTLDSIDPQNIDLAPGEIVEISAKFSVRADAEIGAQDVIGFYFDTASDTPLPIPNYRLIAEIEEGEPQAGQAKCNSAVEAGGDEGGGVTVDLGGFVGKAGFTWEMYSIKDQMNVTVGGVRKTTGCVSGSGTFEFDIPPGAAAAQVEVIPNCEQTTGTQWNFTFGCPLSSTVTADGRGSTAAGTTGQDHSGTGPGALAPAALGAPVTPAPPRPTPLGPTGRTAAEAENNNTIPAANQIGAGDTMTGTISANGDADFYVLNVPRQGELTVTFPNAPAGLDMAFRVLDSNGREVRGWQASRQPGQSFSAWADLKSPGSYVIEVRDSYNNASSASPYSMVATFLPTADPAEPNDALAAATGLGWNQTLAANILPLGDADFYKVDAARQGQLTVSFPASPAAIDMAFRVLDATGKEVRGWQASPEAGKPYSAWIDIKSPGTYVIEVRDSYNNARDAVPYEMFVSLDPTLDPAEPNDEIASATPLSFDKSLSASILPMGDADFYKVDAARQGQLTVSFPASPAAIDMAFRVLDATGKEVRGWQASPEAGKPYSAWVDIKSPGTYVIEVRDSYNNARSADPYAIKLALHATSDPAEPNDTAQDATPIAPGERISASILPIGDADYYRFAATATVKVRIAFSRSPADIDMAFRILAADGRQISGWQSAPEPGARFDASAPLPETGDYLIEVRDSYNNARSPDPYEVSLTFE